MRKKVWKVLKYILITVGCILLIIVAAIYSLRFASVQNFVKEKLINFLESKIETEVSLDRVYVGFPNKIEIENLYLQGQDVDTLLYVHKLGIGLNLPKLLKNTAQFSSIDLDGLSANVVKRADSTFNFDYIIDAFGTEEEEEKESKPFIIDLDKIRLQNLNVNYNDQTSKNDIALRLTDLKTVVKTFDLEQNDYAIDYIETKGLKLVFNQGLLEEVAQNVEETVDSLAQNQPLKVGINRLDLQDFDILYNDENSATHAKIVFGALKTKIDKLDLLNSDFDIRSFMFKDAFVEVLFASDNEQTVDSSEVETDSDQKAEVSAPLKLMLQSAELSNVNVIYNNGIAQNQVNSFDANHLNIKELNGNLKNLSMIDTDISGEIKKLSFIENSGFILNELSTKFKYASTETKLENLYLKTPYTELQRSLQLNYTSVDDFSNDLGNVGIEAKLPKTKIGFRDILWLAPDLKNTEPFNKYPNAVLNLSAEVRGTVNDLLVQEFKLSGLDNLNVNAFGTIKNAMDTDNLWVNLKINDITAGKRLINNLVPVNTIPESVELPEHLSVNGRVKGGMEDIYADIGLFSTYGNAKITATVNQKVKNAEKYDLTASLASFDVGKLIKQDSLGIVTATAKITGTGFDFASNNAEIDAEVKEAVYNNYIYKDISLKGGISQGNYNVVLHSDDENLNLNVVASGVYDEEQPTVKTEGTLTMIDLNKLGFSETPMALAGKIDADFSSVNPDALDGILLLQDFAFSNGEEIYPISEISLKAVSNDSINSIDFNSQLFDIAFTGQYKLTQISSSLLHTLNQYYHFEQESEEQDIETGQYFNFRARFKDDDLIRKFVPELTSFATINIYGAYNADDQKITMYGSVPHLQYSAYKLNDIKLSAGNEEGKLNYAVTLKELDSEQFRLSNIVLDGFVADDLIDYNLLVKNEEGTTQYKIAGNVATANELVNISLKQDGLVLNYDEWNVAENNELILYPNGLVAQNLLLSNTQSSILLQSESDVPESPLNIVFKDFEIADLTEIIRKDELLAEGTINGEVELKDPMTDLRLTTDLNITNLKVFGNEVGTIDAQVANETASLYSADIKLSGFDNNVTLKGNYDTEQSSFDAVVNMGAFQMKTIEAFAMEQLRESKGYISGTMNLSGTTSAPKILGALKFNGVGFGVTQLNSTFQDMNDEMRFTNRGIEFNSFKINDTEGHSLTINGAVLTQTYQDFRFDLRLNTRDFRVINSQKTDNQMIYGTMVIDANLNIKGDMDLPKVDGQITVADKTDFTFVMPQSSPALQEREGIIEFVDQDQVALQGTLNEEETLDETIKGLDVNLNIEVKKEAKMSVVIDQANGDFIKLQGNAQLTGGIDPSGKTTLVGRYEVSEGTYEMSVSALRRRFEIQEGSTIIWAGEPMKADADITAIYKTRAAPLDLVQQQLTDEAELNYYKQRIPFNTFLKMSGELLKPVITFDIEVDGNNPGVSGEIIEMVKLKLDQLRMEESEMNKQVFALLLLNRFIGENPFESSTGLSAESMARQSVSKLLSQQLNNLAADLIGGVEIDFDLDSEEDYSSGTKDTRTDLNVDISKRLFNDRLKVSVGSNIGLEGTERENEKMTNLAGNFEAEYMLSRDGRYVLRAYRKDEYQVALQGQVIETGVGFVITLQYNKFKEILRRQKQNREFRRRTQTTTEDETVEQTN